MKKNFAALVGALAVLACVQQSSAILLGSNITIPDNNYSGSGWYGNTEDNETETNPNTLQGQVWDLEGMFLYGGEQLTLVGGYDFANGATSGSHTYKSGDIFIDVNGNAVYGQAANGGSGTGGTTTSLFGYEYVLDLDYNTMTYDVIDLTTGAVLVRTTDVPSSNPWKYQSGGTQVQGYQDVAFTYYSGLSNADVGGLQGSNGNNTHYAIVVDLGFLADGTVATVHYTYECGNDNLMGQARVPDMASTVTLFGAALLGIAGLRRKLQA